MRDAQEPTALFVLAPSARSGTNFLARSLVECGPFEFPTDRIGGEDYLLNSADLLMEYTKTTCNQWRKWIADREELDRMRRMLLKSIGQGILRYIQGAVVSSQGKLLVKTPSPTNLGLFPHLFPEAQLLILVRDGRDTVQSLRTAWPDESYAYWMEQWAAGARETVAFIENDGKPLENRLWKLVKYEDLCTEGRDTMRDLLKFVKVSADDFDWEKVDNQPLYGPSFACSNEGRFEWRIESKPENFQP